jgi:hypothetical protein
LAAQHGAGDALGIEVIGLAVLVTQPAIGTSDLLDDMAVLLKEARQASAIGTCTLDAEGLDGAQGPCPELELTVTPIALTASATVLPCATSTSACRSFATISSGVCAFFRAIPITPSAAAGLHHRRTASTGAGHNRRQGSHRRSPKDLIRVELLRCPVRLLGRSSPRSAQSIV